MIEADDVGRRVEEQSSWYHTMELAPGIVTPGFFDLRPVVDALPWPRIEGLRCLDVATMDGFYAFELERRGAAEVVAVDIEDQADLDWLPRERPTDLQRGRESTGARFDLAHQALGSEVSRQIVNVYDLSPERIGVFDVVIVGALLEHLRDPLAALEAVRSVTRGVLLSVEQVDLRTSVLLRGTPVQRLVGHTRTWSEPNRAGHLAMLQVTGFDIVDARMVGIPLGPSGRDRPSGPGLPGLLRRWVRRLGRQVLTGTPHWPFSAVHARPASDLPQHADHG
ncbi:MAG: class I SAM-dependent methyltransferase [Actinobacteria bacterium]|nr:class I SAM-dependent methyltransferase [Actinomycetota bacterium]